MLNALINYLKSSIEELKKVAWPTRSETIRYSALVVGISVGLALAIGILDFALTQGLEKLIEIVPTTEQAAPETETQRIPISPSDLENGVINIGDIQVETTPTE